MFKLAVDIHKEMETLVDNYSDEIWFDDLDQRVFTFKHKVHNWLKESEHKAEKKSCRSSSSKSKSLKGSKTSRSSRSSTREKAIEEKFKVAELEAEVAFIKKQRDTEYQSHVLKMEVELAKAQARAKVFDEEEKLHKDMIHKSVKKPDDIKTIEGMSELNSKGVPSLKGVYLEDNSSDNSKSTFLGNPLKDECQHLESRNVTELLCKLVKEQSAPQVDLEPISGNTLTLHIFSQCLGKQLRRRLMNHEED